ncbi:MAG: family 1 glycosylhydrolase [Candidatus Thalassarchaeaceae archaeon]|nr:family 1 glycosylhydrolase [Candidatus Thalassarchaeaceae archaeon]
MLWWMYALIALIGYTVLVTILCLKYPERHYNWDDIDTGKLDFPSEFAWGVATASHQIEGGNVNNWSQFESATGKELSGIACDHWNKWKSDFDLIEKLGVGHYRFSIEWSRIQPNESEWNEDAVAQYSAMIDELISRGIEPMVTLHHFSHPIWFEEKGGFLKNENIHHWVSYCEKIFGVLSDRVTNWCTVNEPEVFSIMGYHMKLFPPGMGSIRKTIQVMKNVVEAHATAYHALKKIRADAKIGLAKNVTIFDPLHRWNLIHWITTFILNHIWNGAIISALKRGRMFGRKIPNAKDSLDYMGLNYYTHALVSPFLPQTIEVDLPKRSHEIMTEFGYPMYAEGLKRSVELLKPLNVPIEITENGVADSDDSLRPIHLKRHLWMISEMIKSGADIHSYYHWSLMDNFEWAEGYSLRFGLYHVDYETQERTLRSSGELYRKIVSNE